MPSKETSVNQAPTTNTASVEKKITKINLSLNLEVNTGGNALGAQIAGQILEKELEKSKTFATTGKKTTTATATGQVKIFNNSSQKQSLVATTRLLSSNNILYRLKNQVVVPAKGNIEAAIYADKAGKEFEVGPTKFTIPGLSTSLQQLIYAESSAPTTGGSQEIAFLTKDDLDKAQNDLKEETAKEALDNFKKEIQASQALLDNLINQEIISSIASSNIDEKVENFTLTMKIKNQALAFSQVDITNKLNEELGKQIPSGSKLDDYKLGAPQYSFVKYDKEKGLVTIAVKAEAQ